MSTSDSDTELYEAVKRFCRTEQAARNLVAFIKADRDRVLAEVHKLLADIVKKATPFGEDEDGFITEYIMPVGPIHRAIPYLDERGISRSLTTQSEKEKE